MRLAAARSAGRRAIAASSAMRAVGACTATRRAPAAGATDRHRDGDQPGDELLAVARVAGARDRLALGAQRLRRGDRRRASCAAARGARSRASRSSARHQREEELAARRAVQRHVRADVERQAQRPRAPRRGRGRAPRVPSCVVKLQVSPISSTSRRARRGAGRARRRGSSVAKASRAQRRPDAEQALVGIARQEAGLDAAAGRCDARWPSAARGRAVRSASDIGRPSLRRAARAGAGCARPTSRSTGPVGARRRSALRRAAHAGKPLEIGTTRSEKIAVGSFDPLTHVVPNRRAIEQASCRPESARRFGSRETDVTRVTTTSSSAPARPAACSPRGSAKTRRRACCCSRPGPPDRSLWIHLPIGYGKTMWSPRYNWCFSTDPDPNMNGRRIYWPRGKTLGGSSSINGLIYIRGQREDYDHWAALGNAGWGYDDVLPYFIKSEGNQRGASAVPRRRRAAAGLRHRRAARADRGLHRRRRRDRRAAHRRLQRRAPGRRRLLPAHHLEGLALQHREGLSRAGAAARATCASRPRRRRPACVLRRPARGRRALPPARRARRRARCRAEVLLAAGAIQSPQLLQLSGIGPARAAASATASTSCTTLPGRRREPAGPPADPPDLRMHASRSRPTTS